VLADLIRPACDVGDEIAARFWDQEVKRCVPAIDRTLPRFDAFVAAQWNYDQHKDNDKIDKPSLICKQIDWLREAGFINVDVHWIIAGYAIISGWR
jgi:tRNA (cmo5U34)-methyltransferase